MIQDDALTTQQREDRYASGLYKKRGITIVRGSGARLWGEDGREYVDCVGGQGVCTLGHCNPAVAQAIAEQAQTLVTCPESFHTPKRAEFLEALFSIAPEGLDRAFLCSSGTEAIEAALKFARVATGRTKIISTVRGFHGRSFGSLSATHEPSYRKPFEPLVPDFHHIPYNKVEALDAVDGEAAALIVEAIQGEGGVHPAQPEFLRAAREACDRSGAMLIVDEVQSGFGRTGRWFAGSHAGVIPDLMPLAKAIAGGMPMGACLMGPRVKGLQPGMHGTTFGGNPLACAAGVASINEMKRMDLPRLAQEKGEWFVEQFRRIEAPIIREVRGLGLLLGIDLKVKVAPAIPLLAKRGVLAIPTGMTVLRFLPPAVIVEDQMNQVVEATKEVLTKWSTLA